MKFRIIALLTAVVLAIIVTLPAQAQVRLDDLNFQNRPVEPGAGLAMQLGTQTGSAALGDGALVFQFNAVDVDPIADDASDVAITCVLIQNLGTAVVGDITQIMLMDQDSNGLALGVPVAAGSAAPPAPECASMATTGPNAQVQFEVFFNDFDPNTGGNQPFIIPDDGIEMFQVAIRTAETDALLDDSQNHTLVLRANIQMDETVGSPPALTTFVDPVTDGAPEVIWNGGVNSFTEDTWVVNPVMPGASGVVSRFTVCDNDADEDQLILHRFFVRQDEGGSAISSDIVSLDLFRVEGFTRTLVASRTPDESFDRGSGTVPGLAIPGGANTAITIPDDTCMTFELEAQVSPFAMKGHIIAPRISVDASEPNGTILNETVEPEIRTRPTMIGTGLLVLPDTRLIGKPGIIPLQVSGMALPGLGTLQVGPSGRLQFDPRVISITDIVGVGPYIVSATSIDNRLGEARFTVQVDPSYDADADGNPDNPLLTALQSGTVAHLLVQPTGQPGSRTRLVLTFDCVELVDQNNCVPQGFPNPNVPNQKPNNDISVLAGEVSILHPGDIDFDGTPTIRDSLMLANAILVCSTFTETQTTSTTLFSTTLQDVTFQNIVSATANSSTLTNNTGAGVNGGAVSMQSLTFGDGFVETTINETNTTRVFGLSKADTNQSIADINFGIVIRDDGTLRVTQNGVETTPTPASPDFNVAYNTGDVLRVEISGPNVVYKRNGVAFHVSGGAISNGNYPLFVDTALVTDGATLEAVRVQSLNFSQTNSNIDIGLTDEQRSVADVVAPFAPVGQIPGCGTLTSADVAEIARLAINFGTTPAPSAKAAAMVTEQANKPWYSFVTEFVNWVTGANAVDMAQLSLNQSANAFNLGIENVPGMALGGIQGRIAFNPMTTNVHSVSGVNGYNVVAYEVDNALGEIRFVALAPKGQGIYDGQVVRVSATSAHSATMALNVDALIDEAALDIPFTLGQSQAPLSAPSALSVNQVQALSVGDGYRFQALGTGIEGIQVQVFNLGGAKVFDQQADGNALGFHALTDKGQPLANGVYLYVITAKGANGEQIRSAVNKLAILR